jgi:hypothetical protein
MSVITEVKRMPNWSNSDKRYLRENYGVTSMDKIRKHLGRTDSAIHTQASLLKIAGVRWGLDRRHNNLVTTKKAIGRKQGDRTKIENFNTKKHKTIPFTTVGKRWLKIDNKTHMLIKDTTTEKEVQEILERYRNRKTPHKTPF